MATTVHIEIPEGAGRGARGALSEQMAAWTRANCGAAVDFLYRAPRITFRESAPRPGWYVTFDDERDAVLFKMKFG